MKTKLFTTLVLLTLTVTASAMQIFIMMTNNQIITLEVEPSDSFENLKSKIWDKTGFEIEDQILTYNNQELPNDKELRDYSIQNEATLLLTLNGYFDLTAEALDHGTIAFTVDGNETTIVKAGKTVTVTVTPDAGYTVQSITGEWSTTFGAAHSRRRRPALTTIPVLGDIALTPVDGQENTWTFTMEAANATFAATFATIPYTVSLAEGTADADKWAIDPAEAKTTGVAKGTEITATYSGTKHVKSVKATKKAAAYAANEYNEASWDGTKVTFTKQTAASVTAVANSDAAVTWGDGWYTVSGDVTITGNVTLTADAHLILQDGAKLTINGQLNCRINGKNLYIYGQKNGDGKLNVTNNGANAINSHTNYRIDIHGGEVTAAATGNNGGSGLNTGYLAVYGGKLTATSDSRSGINFQNTFNVYGGEVEATSNATSDAGYGISSGGGTSSQILTVYGGKVTATGNGIEESPDYGSGFGCYVKSGTSGIKFYFSDNGTDWGEGASYASATDGRNIQKRYAKAE